MKTFASYANDEWMEMPPFSKAGKMTAMNDHKN